MNAQVMISFADIDKPNKKGISKITLNFFYNALQNTAANLN